MKTTTYKFGIHTVRIHDPAETAEEIAQRQKRLEKACSRFMSEVERERAKTYVKR